MLYFLYAQLASIFLLTGLGNLTLRIVVLVVLLFLSFYKKKRPLVLGFFIGALFVARFENAIDRNIPTNSHSLQGVVVGVRSLDSYELETDFGTVLMQTRGRTIPLDHGRAIYATVQRETIARPVSYSRSSFSPHGMFSQNFEYEKWLIMKGYSAAYTVGRLVEKEQSKRFVRNTISETIVDRYGFSKEAALLQGMLIGGRVGMDDDQYSTFIDSGLVHIIAVSGSNIMMLLITLQYLLFFLPVSLRRIVSIAVVVIYLFICGFDSSIVRATIMALIKIVVIFWGAKVSFPRIITYTCTLMFLYNPYFLLFDLGFLLSLCALLGIRFVTVYFKNAHKIIVEYLLVPLFAFLGVMPVLLVFVGSLNVMSFMTTILLGPFLLPLLVVSSASLLIQASRLTRLGQWGLTSIYILSERGQQFGVYVTVGSFWLSIIIVTVIMGLFFLLAVYNRKKMSTLPTSTIRM